MSDGRGSVIVVDIFVPSPRSHKGQKAGNKSGGTADDQKNPDPSHGHNQRGKPRTKKGRPGQGRPL